MRKIGNYFLLLLSPIFIMIGLLTAGQTVSATSGNELTNVITDTMAQQEAIISGDHNIINNFEMSDSDSRSRSDSEVALRYLCESCNPTE